MRHNPIAVPSYSIGVEAERLLKRTQEVEMSISKPPPIAIESIHGVWYLSDSRRPDGSWLLKRDSDYPMGWGQRFEFHVNGVFVKAYSMRCAVQEPIHHWTGIWKWNDETGILFAQVKDHRELAFDMKPSEDYLRGREFHVIEASDERMVLLPITKETIE